MAGVGFELKRLFRARTATGHLKAYSYSAIVTTGPFALLTSMVLLIQTLFQLHGTPEAESAVYLGAVVYSFVFSQLLSCGFTIVLTRYLADCITVQHYRDVTPSLFGMSAILLVLGAAASALFFWDKPLAFELKLLSYLFFSELLLVWTASVYLTAVKRFKYLILGYLAGVLLSVALAALLLELAWLSPAAAALFAMDVGMGALVLFFFLYVTSRFGLPKDGMIFAFLPYLGRHGRLFIGAFGYTLGLFLPNIHLAGPVGRAHRGHVPLRAALRRRRLLRAPFHPAAHDDVRRQGGDAFLRALRAVFHLHHARRQPSDDRGRAKGSALRHVVRAASGVRVPVRLYARLSGLWQLCAVVCRTRLQLGQHVQRHALRSLLRGRSAGSHDHA